jgi:mRNA-degrading endonuclease HigB of HigAB toxin-antitoxin module
MHVIARPKLREFAKRHVGARDWLENWWTVASSAVWKNLHDVRRTYAGADQVGKCLIFNKGNDYRLIVRVNYANRFAQGTLFVKRFLTHAEYGKNDRKGDCE